MKKKGKRFDCTVCGDCCTNFNIVIDPWVEDGLVHMVQDSSIGVEIWPWEARVLIPEAEASDLGLALLPSNLILDKMRDMPVVLSYFMANGECVFLDGKECKIYKERPNVCRYFPLVLARPGLRVTERCPDAVMIKTKASGQENVQALKHAYGDYVDHLMRDIYIHENMIDLLGRLELSGDVKWEWSPDPDHVLKKVQDQAWMDLLEFIIDIGFMTPEEVQELIVDILYAEDLDKRVDLKLLTL